MLKSNVKLLFIAFIILIGISCSDETNNEEMNSDLETPQELEEQLQSSIIDFTWTMISYKNVIFDLQADIIGTSNAANGYWQNAKEPKIVIENELDSEYKDNIEFIWAGCYAAINSANDIIRFQEEGNDWEEVDGNKNLAAAYLLKGIAEGQLSYIYDKAYIVNYDSEISDIEFQDYRSMLDASIANINKSIEIYDNNPTITYDYITDSNLSSEEASRLAHTYAARFIAGNARNSAERMNTNWTEVKLHTESGLLEDFNPTSDENVIYNGQHAWNTQIVSNGGTAFLPIDFQVTNLADPTSATSNLEQEQLERITTEDARFGLVSDGEHHDFEYYPNTLLASDPDPLHETFYSFQRFAYNYNTTNTGNPMHIITAEENYMLLIEAEYHLGNLTQCQSLLNEGSRITRGELTPLTDTNAETLENTIYYENIIGLHSCGAGIALAYMRRWDRLQKGAILHLPVPAIELDEAGESFYTFGGEENATNPGTADGSNAWK